MKMVKSLLLGSAAGLVAVAGAQAADLPVKAKPVQYVKICSLYGAGFYYIPGTDMCIKMGGWVRFEYGYGANGSFTWGPYNGNKNDRTTNNSVFRARGYITADARDQTAYGTVRGYIAVGLSTNDVGLNTAANTFSSNRAFIQWAGFTFGLAQSFFDFYSAPATSYWGFFPASDTGDSGWLTAGYTAQFGNGWSATIAVEERRMTQIINGDLNGLAAGGTVAPGAFPTAATVGGVSIAGGSGFAPGAGAYGGFNAPDIVANARVDQTWGSAQIMGALHQLNTVYYGGTGAAAVNTSGNPSDKWGFAVGGGVKLNAPFIGKGDYLQAEVAYAEGASRYIFMTPNSNWGKNSGATGTEAFGVLSDSVFGGTVAGGTATSQNLTTAWHVDAAYEHFWNPAWRTSLYGGYAAVSYNTQANAILCAAEGLGAGVGSAAVATVGCNNNWQTAWIGSRTQWNVNKDFYLGVDVMYFKMMSADTPNNAAVPPTAIRLGGANSVGDVDNWAVRFRAHRDFYP